MKELKQTLCERCGKRATVFYKENVNGKTREMHLCADCAAREGVGKEAFHLPGFWDDGFFGVSPLFAGLFGGETASEQRERCPRCGKSLAAIREDGRFGCSQCYETFGDRVDLKAFTGGYKGAPLTAGGTESAAPAENVAETDEGKLARLKEELKQAVAAEAYEKAAALRDEIRGLEGR